MSRTYQKRYLNSAESFKTSAAVTKDISRPDIRQRHVNSLFKSGCLVSRIDNGQLEKLDSQSIIIKILNPKSFFRYDAVDGFDRVYTNNNRDI